jgi:hypothetical protein
VNWDRLLFWLASEGKVDPGEGYEWRDQDEKKQPSDPCPASWCEEFMELRIVADQLKCSVPEAMKQPMYLRYAALHYGKAMEKVKPFLEQAYKDREEHKKQNRAILDASKR